METATSAFQHSYGLGPRGLNLPHGGAQQDQGPHLPTAGPAGAPRPEEQPQQPQQPQQPHHKPFFYIQPSQQYMPMQSMQWPVPVPMPVSYNPYYPGLGYGMPMMSPYQPNPYMEPPGFVVPHTHLHLMDYRRMLNPQYYQTMAYHSRRFRYQHNSQAKEMTTSEVQTEPLSAIQRTSTPGSSTAEAPSVVRQSDSNPIKQPLSPVLAVQKADPSLELKDAVPSSTTRTTPNGSFLIQTEEVRFECTTTPVGLQLLHSHETAEVSTSFSQDVVHCSSSVIQGRVRQDEGRCLPADQPEQALQACPDILLVGTPSGGEKIPALEDSKKRVEPVTVVAGGDVQEAGSEKDPTEMSKNFKFKVVHLPFDPKYLDKLWKMESTVWSMEETVIPSNESLIQNGCTAPDETGAAEAQSLEEAAPEEGVSMIQMPPLAEDELEELVPAVEMEKESKVDTMNVAEEAPVTHKEEAFLASNLLLLDNSPLKALKNQHRQEPTVQDHQDTSFESLPAYLPSTSWLADFDGAYYGSKMPLTPKKQNKPVSNRGLDVATRRRKLDLDYREHPTVRKPKERYKPAGKVDRRSLSDHECCVSRSFNENTFTPYAAKSERLCSRCVAKNGIWPSTGPGLAGHTLKRKPDLFKQWNDALLPTCETCKSHTKKRLMRNTSGPDVPRHGHETEEESSENGSCHLGSKWRPVDHPRKLNNLKKPLASKQNVERSPVASYQTLREKNCACNEPSNPNVAWGRLRHCPHGNAIRQMDENCGLQDRWRIMDQIYLTNRWQTEKSRKAVMPNPDSDGSKKETGLQHFNAHKKSQSQGIYRKDTRC